MKNLFIIFVLLFTIKIYSQNKLFVPSQYSTIQSALNTASIGDTILVEQGIYKENIIWPNQKNLTLISSSNNENTIIDGNQLSSVITFNSLSNVDTLTTIEGFTITNGKNTDYGGGLTILNTSLKLKSCKIIGNSSFISGGGIYIQATCNNQINVFIYNSEINNNNSLDGGGIRVNSTECGVPITNLTLYNSVIKENTASRGGGLFLSGYGKDYFYNTEILENEGEGIYTRDYRNSELIKVTIAYNKGKGISSTTNFKIYDSRISSNENGGILISLAAFSLYNVIIDDNKSDQGGGIQARGIGEYRNHSVWNKVFILNNQANKGGGVDVSGYISVDSSVFSGNKAEEGGAIRVGEGKLSITYSTIAFNNAIDAGALKVNEDGTSIFNSNILSNVSIDNAISLNSNGRFNIINSNIINNKKAIINFNSLNIVDAFSNYWGDSSGCYSPTQNPNGKGDSVSLNVKVLPFLFSPDINAPPIPVQNLRISSTGNDFIDLSWDPSPLGDLSGYKICYKTDSTEIFYTDTIDVGNVTSYSLSGLAAGLTYYIAVICYDTDGNSSWYSHEINATPQPIPVIFYSTNELDFGTIVLGHISEKVITISNTGTATLNVTNIISQDSQFIPNQTQFNVPVGENKDLTIAFSPTIYGEIKSHLKIISNAYNNSELIIQLRGFGDLSPNPKLVSIEDIPDDQGKEVRIKFGRSKYDGLDSTLKIVSYSVWRLIKDSNWDGVGMFNAVQDSFYYFVAPTLGDSTVHGIVWSTFKVSAHTENPDIFYYSDSLRGYSIDNIAPGVPAGLLASSSNDGILLTWQSNDEKDFQYYGIYRSTQSNFNPDTIEACIYVTSDTFYTDSDILKNTNYYYRISAFDYAGNQSDFSLEVNAIVVGIRENDLSIPTDYSLSQNYPNPFNPVTTISYQLPKSSFVKLSIYDIKGRLIETLVNEQKNAGYYSIYWNSENVVSGLYFYRIDAGDFIDVKKCLVVK